MLWKMNSVFCILWILFWMLNVFTTNDVAFNLYCICRRLVNIARSKKLREQQGKVVLEGKHLIRSALDAGAIAQNVYFSSVDALRELPLDKLRRTSIVKVRMEDPKIWSDLDISKNIIGKRPALTIPNKLSRSYSSTLIWYSVIAAIFKRPEASHLTFSEEKCGKPLPLTLICDNVRDPGNLAAVLCSAAAAGCHSVLLTKGTSKLRHSQCIYLWNFYLKK